MNQIDLYAINIMIFMLVLCLNVALCSFIRLQYCACMNNDAIVSDTRYTESNYERPSRAMSSIILSHK